MIETGMKKVMRDIRGTRSHQVSVDPVLLLKTTSNHVRITYYVKCYQRPVFNPLFSPFFRAPSALQLLRKNWFEKI